MIVRTLRQAPNAPAVTVIPSAFDCQSCGACCSYSADWPRFSTETDADLDLIPEQLVAADGSGMRCAGVRCSALTGEVGKSTSCSIYGLRPDVCRICQPGDDACLMARGAFGMTNPERSAPR
jgi:Fe-S-cluster containining protein